MIQPVNMAVAAGLSKFRSIFETQNFQYGSSVATGVRSRTTTRGIIINKDFVDSKPMQLDKGYSFQFNPNIIQDTKETLYETRNYAGLSYNDYIWSGGSERIISFQLFLDNTPQSKIASFRPDTLANTLKVEGVRTGDRGELIIDETDVSKLSKLNINPGFYVAKKSPGLIFEGASSYNTRVHKRGIMPEVELIQSFLYAAQGAGEPVPKFMEGGVVTSLQFRPPSIAVLSIGPIYLEGRIRSAPVTYTLFDEDLTPIRGTIDVEFAVHEFVDVTKQF